MVSGGFGDLKPSVKLKANAVKAKDDRQKQEGTFPLRLALIPSHFTV